jgi:hypothetical protein
MYVDTAEKVSDRRWIGNGFFVTINTAVVKTFDGNHLPYFLGIAINVIWYFFIESCKKLNGAKFQVIHKMEKELPYAPFKEEEKIYKEDKRLDFSTIEKWIPIVFCVVYLIKWYN